MNDIWRTGRDEKGRWKIDGNFSICLEDLGHHNVKEGQLQQGVGGKAWDKATSAYCPRFEQQAYEPSGVSLCF